MQHGGWRASALAAAILAGAPALAQQTADIDFETIDENRDEWIEAWTDAVLR